jgi:hypothetical protein
VLTPHCNRALRGSLGIPLEQNGSLSCSLHGEEDVLNFNIAHISRVTDFNHDLWIVHVGICGARSDELRPASTNNNRTGWDLKVRS